MLIVVCLGCASLLASQYLFRALPTVGLNAGLARNEICVDQFGHAAAGCVTTGEVRSWQLLTVNAFQVATAVVSTRCLIRLCRIASQTKLRW